MFVWFPNMRSWEVRWLIIEHVCQVGEENQRELLRARWKVQLDFILCRCRRWLFFFSSLFIFETDWEKAMLWWYISFILIGKTCVTILKCQYSVPVRKEKHENGIDSLASEQTSLWRRKTFVYENRARNRSWRLWERTRKAQAPARHIVSSLKIQFQSITKSQSQFGFGSRSDRMDLS